MAVQETVSAGQTNFVARELKSGTDYLVTIISQYPNSVGEPVSAKQRTSESHTHVNTQNLHTPQKIEQEKKGWGYQERDP